MEIRIDIDGDAMFARLQEAIEGAANLRDQLPVEFTAWQEHDMGRRRADTSVPDPMTVSTVILPRGRPPLSLARRSSRQRSTIYRRGTTTAPPILRPELLVMLRERMSALLQKAFD